jgi:hypothetical protein
MVGGFELRRIIKDQAKATVTQLRLRLLLLLVTHSFRTPCSSSATSGSVSLQLLYPPLLFQYLQLRHQI